MIALFTRLIKESAMLTEGSESDDVLTTDKTTRRAVGMGLLQDTLSMTGRTAGHSYFNSL